MSMRRLFHKDVDWLYTSPDDLYNGIMYNLKSPDFEVFDEIYTPGKPEPLSQRLIYSHVRDGENLLGIIRLSIESRYSASTAFVGGGQLKPYRVNVYASPFMYGKTPKEEIMSRKVDGLLERLGLKEIPQKRTVEASS